jgi:ribosome-binding factor A
MSRRAERLSHGLQRRLAEILEHRMSDPRLEGLTVVEVKASPDASFARVFYRTLDTDREPAAQALAKAKSYIRRLLAEELPLRRVPELDFRYDPAADSGARVDQILREIAEESHEPDDGSD